MKTQIGRYLVVALAFLCTAYFAACAIESDGNGGHDAGPTDEGGQTDEDVGGDETTCDNDCNTAGERICVANGFQVCEDTDNDGCLEWSDVTQCGSGEECKNGECGVPCDDGCMAGAARCLADSEAIEFCGDYDEDPCREWGGQVLCESGKVCQQGACVCDNACQFGMRRCADGVQAYETCADHTGDGCLSWGGQTECRTGLLCDEGECRVNCTDACDESGASRCVGNASEMCGDFDDDPCLEWGAHSECPAGAACDEATGQCLCSNVCTLGQTRCDPDGSDAFQTCVDDNGDQCPEWGTLVACQMLEYCNTGAGHCMPICTDQCENQGEKRCLTTTEGFESCDDHNGDNCIEWGGQTLCEAGFHCEAGECLCSNICEIGDYQCAGTGAHEECGDFNSDGCPEWGNQVACETGLECVEGAGQCCPPYPPQPYDTGMGDTVENECLERTLCNGSTPTGTESFCFDELRCRKAILLTIHTAW